MEFETIFYIVIGILYFVWRALQKSKRQKKKEQPQDESRGGSTIEGVIRNMMGGETDTAKTDPANKPPDDEYIEDPWEMVEEEAEIVPEPKPVLESVKQEYVFQGTALEEEAIKEAEQDQVSSVEDVPKEAVAESKKEKKVDQFYVDDEEEVFDFDLRDAIIKSIILEKKYH